MVADHRITYRRRHSYNTRSNRIKGVRTPSGKLVAHYLKKSYRCNAAVPKCPVTKKKLQGVTSLRRKLKNPRGKRVVTRAYGGDLSYGAVKQKIIRAFLIEEQRIVKKVMKQKMGSK